MSARKGNILLPIVSVIALGAIASAGYFYWQTQQNHTELFDQIPACRQAGSPPFSSQTEPAKP